MSPTTGTNTNNSTSGSSMSDVANKIPGINQDRLDGMKDKFSGVMEGLNGNVERVTGFIKARPMATFGAALGVGFLVGTIVLRSKNRSANSSTGSVQ